jgi:formamidopyrimidine-DNA glycosylase
MPELPDVEVYKRYLDATTLHQRIDCIHVQSPELLHDTTPQGLGHLLKRHRFTATRRHGKYLFLRTDCKSWLVLHFGMSGHLKYFGHGSHAPRYTCLLIKFENGFNLAYEAQRKLGKISSTQEIDSFIDEHRLGPDALGIKLCKFAEIASAFRGGAKSFLMNQHIIAGIGNIYSDEILFQSGIYPKTPLARLDEPRIRQLHKIMHRVLNKAIALHADPERIPHSWLLPQRKPEGTCPKCRQVLTHMTVAGRTAYYCQHCQPRKH